MPLDVAYREACRMVNAALFGTTDDEIQPIGCYDMHPSSKTLFGGLRFCAWRIGDDAPPPHGGTRVIDIQQSRRAGGTMLADIAREQTEHRATIDAFHRVFYASKNTHGMTFYEGVPVLKNPMDLWVYQEIIWDLKPTLIIETGTAFGGSALYFARQLDRLGAGHVVSIDIEPADRLPQHPRITYVRGLSSVADELVARVADVVATHPRVMVTLDSDHAMRHVSAELDAYAPFVTPGQFLIVEDTNINGRPVPIDWKGGPGPGPAVDAWLPHHPDFARARMAERYLLTMHTWLRRTPEVGSA